MSQFDWAGQTAPECRAALDDQTVVILPLGAVEQHGPHLPMDTDTRLAEHLTGAAMEVCAKTLKLKRLPALAFGQGLEHADYAGSLTLSPATLEQMIVELGASVARSGARRLVLFSAHGGNLAAMDNAALRLRYDWKMLVVKACYFNFPPLPDALPAKEWREGLHGGALETALMQYFAPHSVRTDELGHWPMDAALSGARLAPEGSSARWAWLAQDLHAAGVVGDARLANAALGARLAAHYAGIFAEVLAETAAFDLCRFDSTP